MTTPNPFGGAARTARSAAPRFPGPGSMVARTPTPATASSTGPSVRVAATPSPAAMPPPLVPRDSSYRSMVSGPSFTPTARETVRLAWPLRVRPSREEYERSASTSTTSPSSGSRSSRNDTPVLVTANRPAATASRRIASADSPDTSMVRVTANDRAVRETSSSARTVTGSDPSGSARVRSTLILAPAAALPGLSVLRPVRRSGSLPARSRRAIPVPRSPPAARPTESRLLSGTRSSAVPRAYGATPSPPSTPPAAVGGRPNTVSPASEEPATSEPTSGRKSCVIGGWGGGDPPCSRLRGRARQLAPAHVDGDVLQDGAEVHHESGGVVCRCAPAVHVAQQVGRRGDHRLHPVPVDDVAQVRDLEPRRVGRLASELEQPEQHGDVERRPGGDGRRLEEVELEQPGQELVHDPRAGRGSPGGPCSSTSDRSTMARPTDRASSARAATWSPSSASGSAARSVHAVSRCPDVAEVEAGQADVVDAGGRSQPSERSRVRGPSVTLRDRARSA